MAHAYDPNNIFAKILRGEAPCVKVFEDETALAFMDIMPRGEGHIVIVPKIAARNILDIAPADLARFMPSVQKVAVAAKDGLNAEGVKIEQYNEPAAGQTVYHLHFHILPRWTGVALKPPGGPMVSADVLAPIAEKIRAAIARE
ncbi:MAG TPA: HIT domain-containing protein [Roseiarcus sp.]|nr:HIT domain-containing protein [Roseiarcus sp.]